jgi:hypothetical protein
MNFTSGFHTRRVPCTLCGSSRSFAPLEIDERCGYCFSCGTYISPYDNIEDRAPPRSAPVRFRSIAQPRLSPDAAQTKLMPRIRESLAYAQKLESEVRSKSAFARTLIDLTSYQHLFGWYVGLSADTSVTFWMRDQTGHIVNGKTMHFQDNGFNRIKSIAPRIEITHSEGGDLPLYGIHQLALDAATNTAHRDIILVESEKTAIIASFHDPRRIWLATSGATGLTREKAAPLRDRVIYTLYDNDEAGERGAQHAAQVLSGVNAKARILRLSDFYGALSDGTDIADLIVSNHPGTYRHDGNT